MHAADRNRPERRGDGWLVVGLVLIFVGVVGSLGALARYKGQPGAVGAVPSRWPNGSPIARTPGRTTVLQFVSPSCPCSRASLHELAEVTAHKDVDTIIVLAPDADAAERTHAAVIGIAKEVPNAHVFMDDHGVEAARFGALTSGQTIVFSPEGHRLYAGGITLARGHEGDNAGLRAVVAALGGKAAHEEAPTYGCALETRERVQ